ncbi:MAG: aminotransferase class I/II-fold pyridoxal phosphate-dependent enzyme [Lysobacterales bacterium]
MTATHSPAPSHRLREVRYEIRGELARRAHAIEAAGRNVIKLNIGNPGLFGFETPGHLRAAVALGLPSSEAYCHQQGLPQAREAIAQQQQQRGAPGAHAERVWLGNGVSELIDICLRALLDAGDEVLIPAPDYPLWSAATVLNDGVAVHYPCLAQNGFVPEIEAIEALITPRTRALVVINPNNPSGAVYPRAALVALAELATRHGLVLMADEIYDGLLYDDAVFEPLARLAPDALCLSFGGLSKVHRACGYRAGWVSLSGALAHSGAYQHALDLLSALRLCANVAAQWAIAPALTGPDTSAALTRPGGRLFETRRVVIDACARSPALRLVSPRGALYAFPGVNPERCPGFDDHAFALELLEREGVLLVPGSSFNVAYRNHLRLTLLPDASVMADVFARIERTLARHVLQPSQRHVA